MQPVVTLLKKLMAFRPVSGDIAQVNRCVDFLRQHLAARNVYTRIERLQGRKILYAATVRHKHPPLLFSAHLDVVPADEKNFRFRMDGDWIMGRGTGDCLGHCALLAQLLGDCRSKADFGAIFSTDEEIGGFTTKAMIDRGYRGRAVVLLDSTGRKGDLTVAQKGMLTLKLIATGKTCHGSTPWAGRNAIDRLIDGYLRVRRIFPVVRRGDQWHTTLSANLVNAGTVFNRVPDRAEMVLDIRFTEKTPPHRLMRQIRRVSGLKVERTAFFPLVCSDINHPFLRAFSRFMAGQLRHPVRLVRINGSTDARHFAALRAPIVIINIPYEGAHEARERASLKGLLAYQRMLAKLCAEDLNAMLTRSAKQKVD